MKRVRPAIETSISFLMRRVSKSDVDDWWKLKRVLAYLKKTIDDVRVIGATSLTQILTWIDASFEVHGLKNKIATNPVSLCFQEH